MFTTLQHLVLCSINDHGLVYIAFTVWHTNRLHFVKEKISLDSNFQKLYNKFTYSSPMRALMSVVLPTLYRPTTQMYTLE